MAMPVVVTQLLSSKGMQSLFDDEEEHYTSNNRETVCEFGCVVVTVSSVVMLVAKAMMCVMVLVLAMAMVMAMIMIMIMSEVMTIIVTMRMSCRCVRQQVQKGITEKPADSKGTHHIEC